MTFPSPQDLWLGLPEDARGLLLRVRELAGPEARVALVGGAVRDLLLGQGSASPDLDIVLAGADVEELAGRLETPFSWHPAYRNATLHLPGGSYADLVSARRESYPAPGASPAPLPTSALERSLEEDLARRDFTLNAAALELLPDGTAWLLSVPGTFDDLRARQLRPLHPGSFRDDASRLVRAARLAARLDLDAHPELLAQVPDALAVADRTPRLSAELRLLLDEPLPGRAARRLADWGAADLLPSGAAERLERLDALAEPRTRTLYAAALLSLTTRPDELAALGLGQRPAELLVRAREGQGGAGTPEAALRDVLGLTLPYPPLQGRDLLELGLSPGPELGRMLGWLAGERRAGRFSSVQDEREAVRARLRDQPLS